MGQGPIFIAGANRSGTTLMSRLLTSHPNISIPAAEPRMWHDFYRQYGDLSQSTNFEYCLTKMMHHYGVLSLNPDFDRVREEFWQGETTYPRLFALIQEHHAEQVGKRRWGDKTPKIERYVQPIFAAYPTAKMLHMIRDPRDRYMSCTNWGRRKDKRIRKLGALGANVARWLHSIQLAEIYQKQYPDRYKIVRYETLVSQPEETLRDICAFLGETYFSEMLLMEGEPEFRKKGGNSSFIRHAGISTASIGRFRELMPQREIAFVQAQAKSAMIAYHYKLEPVQLSFNDKLLYAVNWPPQLARMSLLRFLEFTRNHFPVASRHILAVLEEL